MHITLIAAMERSNGIGMAGKLPWRLKGDLAHFKAYTLGKLIVMGTNTLKPFKKPLPGRRTVLLTRSNELMSKFGNTVEYASSVEQVLALAQGEDELVIAGGAQVYETFMPYATRLIITYVHADVRSDSFFPTISPQWELLDNQAFSKDEDNEYAFNICRYELAK